jgi:hypothetical protein
MKISELHQLIGRPVFNIGDRVRVKSTGQIGWVSHTNLSHGLYKAYHYMVVDENDNYIKGHGLHNGFFLEDIELFNDGTNENSLQAAKPITRPCLTCSNGSYWIEQDCDDIDDSFDVGLLCDSPLR